MSSAAGDPRRHPARTAALVGLVGDAGGGRRTFVDATGASVALPSVVRRLVATDDRVGALLLALDAPLVGCAGQLDGVASLGAARSPDAAAVAAARPDVIVVGARDRTHALDDAGALEALRRVAPVVAVDLDDPAAARADLRALLGSVVVERPTPPRPKLERRTGPPTTRPDI